MEMELINVLANYGFPVFITIWFMFRTEKIISTNTQAIDKLADMVTQLIERKR